jgi:pyruvate kinase
MIHTKIVCTMGPATSSPDTIQALIAAGMDMARVNMSHGAHEQHRKTILAIREAASAAGRPVALLVDLAGPKIRVGDLPAPVDLKVGDLVVFAPEGRARTGELPTTYADLARDVKPGDQILLDDGLLELETLETDGERARFRVVRGGILRNRKGINLPNVTVNAPSLTGKDLRDLEFALSMDAEYVGLSFVRRAADVTDLKQRIGGRALVVAKIEKASALNVIEEILVASDGVMVARGDLGVELPFERVPMAQKQIIQLANLYGRPVITATQMLESMIEYPRPTRAEASDVANAVLDGTDAVMLSGETAVGQYPVEAAKALVRIAREIESNGGLERGPHYLTLPDGHIRAGASAREHAVASATVSSVRQLGSPAVIVITRSGFAARLVSSYRPPVPIFAICTDARTSRQLAAVWGVKPVMAVGVDVTYEALTQFGKQAVLQDGVGKPGQNVVVTAGYPFHTSGSTNTMRVEQL